jgi:type II secretory ATPase GspE/PulE/Tfp pilus assembly ATPase PilB-like protein
MGFSLSFAQGVFAPPRIAFLLCALTFSQMSSAENAWMLAQGGDIYTKAMAAYQGGDYSLAAQLFEQAEVETPGTTEALLYAGRSFVRLQLYEKAEQAFREYVRKNPASSAGCYLLGYVLNRENKPRESLEIYTKAASLAPPTADDLKIVALNYVLLNANADAIHWLQRAVQMDPQNKDAWYYLGRAYYTEARLPDARAAFEKVLELDPRNAKAENNIGLIYESSAKPEDALAAYRNAIAARLKIMCDLDISEKRRPQDGKIKFKKFGPLDIELRVATIPTAGGVEDVVMRILAAGEPIPLDKLGVLPQNMERLKGCISKPYGLFFVCGPTGSGKTTTLHSVLGSLNTVDTKIWTAEDPVEITQKGLRQCQMNPKAGLTFATAMKAFLRADPDIIMVGEMRDKDTTAIGIEASLTGHLVFATLHTNSAPESIIRLLDMGMDPFNFADAILGILAQRLAKRLCGKCKEAYTPAADEVKHFITEYCGELVNTPDFKADLQGSYKKVFERLGKDYGFGKPDFKLMKPKGCDACGGTGYKGRVGLHELLVGTDPIKKLIQEHARVAEILAISLAEGMLTLKMDGMEKVLQGVTDMAQVRAVCIK